MRSIFLIALSMFVTFGSVAAAPVGKRNPAWRPAYAHLTIQLEEARAAAPKGGDEDDGVGWFVAVPALMKPAPLNINVPIPGIPCDKKN